MFLHLWQDRACKMSEMANSLKQNAVTAVSGIQDSELSEILSSVHLVTSGWGSERESMKHKRLSSHRKFFKNKDRNLTLLNNKDRVLHSFCYTKSGLIIESLIFDKPQSDPFDNDLRFNGKGVSGYFGFENSAANTFFQGKYNVGDVVKIPITDYQVVAGFCPQYDNNGEYPMNMQKKDLIPERKLKRIKTFEKRHITDIEVVSDDAGKCETRIIYILYHTEAV